ncbi:MAG: polysaccharide pyruvyl transferase family protein [Pseudomonadota bacterium]|nr:polysaccharide pyruvyl transferase family protein [Pseudomonadota bacterium]
MKNPHFINFRSWSDYSDRDSAELILSRTGRNTGNLLFITALHRVIKHNKFSASMRFERKLIRAEHDGLVIPAANWLSSSSDWANLAKLIEASKMPCVMVGLGAQSHSKGAIPKLTDGTLRLLKIVSERSHSISVRGVFSAEVLAHYGITNVAVTGCPSLLWHVDRPAYVDPGQVLGERVSVCATREDTLASLADKGDRNQVSLYLTRMARRKGYDFIAQTERHDINVGRGTFSDLDSEREALAYVKAAYADTDESSIRAYLSSHLKVFCDVPEWLAYLQGRELVLGTRLHGVIAGLLAGIPGALVMHDARTLEMAENLAIPGIMANKLIAERMNVRTIYEAADYSAFNARMIEYFRQFRAFFNSNGVEVNLPSA